MNFNTNILQVSQSASVALNDKIQKMKSDGKKVFSFNVGDPDFDTHPKIIEFANEAMKAGETHYCPSSGMKILREALAEKYLREQNVKLDSDTEILITSGTVHAYYVLLKAILNRGDEVLVPDPSWMTHANLVKMLGGKPVRVQANIDNQFIPPIESWKKALTNKTKAIVINYPSNPTGAIADINYLQSLKTIAEENKLIIISDEVYEKIIFDDNTHTSILKASGSTEGVCVINSFSKTFAMTGWRVGFLIAPSAIIEQSLKAGQYSITCVPPFIQTAAAKALNDRAVSEWVRSMALQYQKRKDLVKNIIASYNKLLEGFEPKGAFYYFLKIKNSELNSIDLSQIILDRTGVALVPGSVYGSEGEGYLRLSLTSSLEVLEDGFDKILNFVKDI